MKPKTNLFNIFPWFNSGYHQVATIFMLHRVYPLKKKNLSPNENLKISPMSLENFILELQTKGYEFISLDRLYEILQNGEKVKKKIVFTLDDGYRDNFIHAYPLFKKYKVPFTIYITTAFPDRKAVLWWYTLEELLLENDQIDLSNGLTFKCSTKNEKEFAFRKIREQILSRSDIEILENLKQLFKNYEIDWQKKHETLMLDWEQIKKLSQDELCTIGGHTLNHLSLRKLSIEDIIKEVLDANNLLYKYTGKKIKHFAYPFGCQTTTGKREYDIIKELGLKTAVTTRNGNIYLQHKEHMESLPRVYLGEDFNLKKLKKVKKKKFVLL